MAILAPMLTSEVEKKGLVAIFWRVCRCGHRKLNGFAEPLAVRHDDLLLREAVEQCCFCAVEMIAGTRDADVRRLAVLLSFEAEGFVPLVPITDRERIVFGKARRGWRY
jgi:hypothetical protein